MRVQMTNLGISTLATRTLILQVFVHGLDVRPQIGFIVGHILASRTRKGSPDVVTGVAVVVAAAAASLTESWSGLSVLASVHLRLQYMMNGGQVRGEIGGEHGGVRTVRTSIDNLGMMLQGVLNQAGLALALVRTVLAIAHHLQVMPVDVVLYFVDLAGYNSAALCALVLLFA